MKKITETSNIRGLGMLVMNAYAALGGTTRTWIEGPTAAKAQESYALTARANGEGPSFTFRWDSGETVATVRRKGPSTARVTITDTVDGKSFQNTVTVDLRDADVPTPPAIERPDCIHKPWNPGC